MAIDPVCGMSVDEAKGLKLIYKGEPYFFCSEHCFKKFKKEKRITDEYVCYADKINRPSLLKNKVFITGSIIVVLIIVGQYVDFIRPLKDSLVGYLKLIWLPVGIGLIIGGVIDWLVPREYISKILARKKKRTIIYSVISGFLMSACSHGILAIAVQLYKKGASAPAVVAFLLASPWANLPLTILIVGFFGIKGLIFIFSAIVIALISGFIFQILERFHLVETNPNTSIVQEDFSIIKDARNRIANCRYNKAFFKDAVFGIAGGAVSLGNMVLWWIFIGVLLSSIVGAYVPTGWMEKYMGASLVGLLVTLGLATVMEVCSEGTAPLAFEIFKKTGAVGNSFVFLMAGVVTDYTEIGLLWTNIGRRTALLLPVVTVPQVIILGIIYNNYLS